MIYVVQTNVKKNKVMNLKTLKNLYAQVRGYDDWDELANSVQDDLEYEEHWTEICIRAQKKALEKAAENAEIHRLNLVSGYKFTGKNTVNLSGERTIFSIHKESITNPENLIQ